MPEITEVSYVNDYENLVSHVYFKQDGVPHHLTIPMDLDIDEDYLPKPTNKDEEIIRKECRN